MPDVAITDRKLTVKNSMIKKPRQYANNKEVHEKGASAHSGCPVIIGYPEKRLLPDQNCPTQARHCRFLTESYSSEPRRKPSRRDRSEPATRDSSGCSTCGTRSRLSRM